MSHSVWPSALIFAALASAQSLTAVLQTRPDLSSWYELIKPHWEELDAYSNITFLAPNNGAVTAYFNTPQVSGCASTDPAILHALTQYHVLQQEYTSFSSYSVFNTELTDPKYFNTGSHSKSAHIQTAAGADPAGFDDVDLLFSGLNVRSNLVGAPIVFDKGIIHVLDNVLQLPANATTTLLTAGYTIAAGAFFATRLNSILDANNNTRICLLVPTNEAFQQVGMSLLALTDDEFKDVMQYHVFDCTVYGSGAIPDSLLALQGSNVTVTNSSADPTYFDNAVSNDYEAIDSSSLRNVWEINRVLNPRNTTAGFNTSAWPDTVSINFNPWANTLPNPSPIPLCKRVASNASNGPNVGAIAGGVVGGVIGVCLLVAATWYIIRRRRRTITNTTGVEATRSQPEMRTTDHDPQQYFGKPELVGTTTTSPVNPRNELDGKPNLRSELDGTPLNAAELDATGWDHSSAPTEGTSSRR